MTMMNFIENLPWIWTGEEHDTPDIYRCFRHSFVLSQMDLQQEIFLSCAADSLFEVFLNGSRLPLTQYADVPPEKSVATLAVTPYLKEGKNLLAIRVHYLKTDFFTYCCGIPGVGAVLYNTSAREITSTRNNWKWCVDPAYISGRTEQLTCQLGFTFCFDASQNNDWIEQKFDDSSWHDAVLVSNPDIRFIRRPVPLLAEREKTSCKAVQAGIFKHALPDASPAERISSDFLQAQLFENIFVTPDPESDPYAHGLEPTPENPVVFNPCPAGADGVYLITDMGAEYTGFLTFSVEAPAGTVIDVAHGEHLADGRVRCLIQDRKFADRYICKEGINTFTHTLRRIAGRYIELHFSATSGQIKVFYAGLIPLELPLPEKMQFRSSDRLFDRVRKTAERTLTLCMHDRYEDCPWREQALYPYDSRNQILFGYYCWGNYDFAAASLDLLGKTCREDGTLPIISPNKKTELLSIPSFTLVWITELYEHLLYSGQVQLFEKYREQIDLILTRALEKKDDSCGLYYTSDSPVIWNFYEWSENLSYLNTFPQLPYNLYLREALLSASELNRLCGISEKASFYSSVATDIGKTAERFFRDEKKGGYRTVWEQEALDEHVQALMLYHDLVPPELVPVLLDRLGSSDLIPGSCNTMIYLIRGLAKQKERGEKLIWQYLNGYEKMLFSGATSLWETPFGTDDFRAAGSLCHAWSSIHVYWAGAGVLGVEPLEPGFKRFRVSPRTGELDRAQGVVPTPAGDISVKWQKVHCKLMLEITHPQALKPEFQGDFSAVICNGRKIL